MRGRLARLRRVGLGGGVLLTRRRLSRRRLSGKRLPGQGLPRHRLTRQGPAGHRRGGDRGRVAVAGPQAVHLLVADEVLGHHRREVEVRLPHLGPHHVEVDLGTGGQVLVERHDDDAPAARLEVRDDVLHLDHLAGLADAGDDGEGA
ncbi:hypothetical protein GCM10020295_22030 [Streptomyces cinereospinus]